MNPQDELSDIIDNYLNNGMSEEERFAFEEKIAHDETLAAKVNEARLTNEAIYYASLAELKNTIGKDLKDITYKASFNWKKASYISIASLALLSGITTYLVTNNTAVDPRKPGTTSIEKEIKQEHVQENSTTINKEKAVDGNKLHQEYSSGKQVKKDSIQTNNTSIQKSILPIDNTIKNIDKTKAADSENNIQRHDPDLKKTVTSETDNKIICDKSFKINTEASCKQKETGAITIGSDGAYSYTFQVDIRSITGSKGIFYNMSAGVYEILVTYGNECTYTKKVTIPEKWCAMNSPYSFNPDYRETWVMQYEQGASGKLTIYDTSGKEIYSSIFGSGNEYWDGSDIHGGVAATGIYIAVINYTDGRQEKVELTIVR